MAHGDTTERGPASGARVLIVSNRLPITFHREAGGVRSSPSAGGLATGLRGPHEESAGVWIGWPGDLSALDAEQHAEVERELSSRRLRAVHLTRAEVERFYHGYCNGVVWPLFHYLLDMLPLESHDWDVYGEVNRKFADAVCATYRPGDLIWVQDYHLLLLPEILRARLPDARIGFFLHIPFPSSEIFRILPRRAELLRGLLGADLIGFHAPSYVRHFSVSVLRILGIEANVDRIPHEGREVRLAALPMGIDAASFESMAEDPEIRGEAAALRRDSPETKIVLGVDRLDYTKGIPRRLAAFAKLLESHPELRGRVRLIQVATPSRTEVKAYRSYKTRVDGLVGGINGKYGTPHHVPVYYVNKSLSHRELAALYAAADVLLVTPLRDGLNLVAKEYVACRRDLSGVLILSEFAGVASELSEALIVNPYDLDGVAQAIAQALTMDPAEQAARMRPMRERVRTDDVHRWARRFLDELARVPLERVRRPIGSTSPAAMAECAARARSARERVLLLDYDGTLVPLVPRPEMARPDPELLELLSALRSTPGTCVHVLSGRTRETLDAWLGGLPVSLHAEHGLWSRDPSSLEWRRRAHGSTEWKDRIRPLFLEFTKSTPGSAVEEKTAGMVWHYRSADADFGAAQAKELRLLLFELLSNAPVEVIVGDKVVEVRPQGIHKGAIALAVLEGRSPDSLVVAMGDDRTDEDLFAALPEGSVGVHVGPLPSRAPYRVPDPRAARAFLRSILA